MSNNIALNAGFYIAVRALLWAISGWLIGLAIQKGIFPKELVETVSASVSQEQWEAIVIGASGAIVAVLNGWWVKITNSGTVRVPVEAVVESNDPLTTSKPIPVVSPATGAMSVPVTDSGTGSSKMEL